MNQSDLRRELVDSVYCAAVGDEPWEAALGKLGDTFRARGTVLIVTNPKEMKPLDFRCFGFSYQEAASYYASPEYRVDPRAPFVARAPPGVYHDKILYDLQKIERSEAYWANVERAKSRFSLGLKVELPFGSTAYLAILRGDKQGPAAAEEVAELELVAPFLERSITVGHLLARQAHFGSALEQAMERRSDAVILLDRRGGPSLATAKAERILSAGNALRLREGRLGAVLAADDRRLQRLIGGAASASQNRDTPTGGSLLVGHAEGGAQYLVDVTSAPATERFLAGSSISVIVTVTDLRGAERVDPMRLQALFNLSPRECDLAIELMEGTELRGAAERLGIAYNTARNHLRGIFFKTGVGSQGELLRLLDRVM